MDRALRRSAREERVVHTIAIQKEALPEPRSQGLLSLQAKHACSVTVQTFKNLALQRGSEKNVSLAALNFEVQHGEGK